ncbi:peptide ligase PGM1-related protein [Nocardia arthritidis]|uniref:ATP-grasp domain-containing protein n=1 Tax=Nocardia arthritidis TaxID=228602 RepID=A0A6G9YNA2_9NOCA|nr:peptide ligase PGM1-related protein [Nocardia arthritidis]QIS14516.1 hypothetical protein F5544_33400 [Nocardia arthritidis]
MSTLVISNQRTEEMVGDLEALTPEYRRYVANQAQRMIWSMRPGDILVLPIGVDEAFVDYVADIMGVASAALPVLVPPPGRLGLDVLTRDRLLEPGFVAELGALVGKLEVERVLPFHFDSAVAELTKALGLDRGTPGFAFVDQGGGEMLNSKATFRALSAGVGVSVADGAVVNSRERAEDQIWSLLAAGHCAIVKQDFHVAGYGNEIISPVPGIPAVGAHKVEQISDRATLTHYLEQTWPWYTEQGRRRVVIEHYLPNSIPIYAEVVVTDAGVEFVGHGEMRMMPVLNGLIVPAPSADLPSFPGFLEEATELCRPLHAMGYRGTVSIDAIVVPDRRILINEFNCRVGGSSHIHHIGERIVGANYFHDRVLIELRRCTFPPFRKTVALLAEHGLAYDPASRTGVLITVDDAAPVGHSGEYLVVAETLAAAEGIEAAVAALFTDIDQRVTT